MKLAIVHDYLNQYGGAERLIEALHELYPEAPVYTSIYFPENLPAAFKGMDVKTSFMQALPGIKKHFKKYFLLYPRAFSSFNLAGYDVILSSSTAYAKGVKIPQGALHICYCNTPARFIWRYDQYMEKEELGKLSKVLIKVLAGSLKEWDVGTAQKVDYFIANSENVRKRIREAYKRESEVIYPPIETGRFPIAKDTGDYFLVVSRLNAYKRIDLVVEAFNDLRLPLRIIGDGPYRKNLQALIKGRNIQLLGRVDEKALLDNYAHCRALIFPGEEDFGITPLEAQSCGRPVIAYAAGGALETIQDGISGIFFKQQTERSLMEAIKRFQEIEPTFNSQDIRSCALCFDQRIFKRQIHAFILEKYQQHRRQ